MSAIREENTEVTIKELGISYPKVFALAGIIEIVAVPGLLLVLVHKLRQHKRH